MKRGLFTLAWIGLLWLHNFVPAIAQQLSTNQVNYQLTYDASNEIYTVWVVPKYATPNANNSDASEFGATAQVSLKVPKDFVIQNITDIKGIWEKNPLKLGSQSVFTSANLDPNFNYYVIGKTPTETNYGPFVSGTPVSLFTFRGNACNGPVGILAKADPFIEVAKTFASLNTACSFYSRSGQTPSGNVIPLEQFADKLGPDANCTAPCVKPNAGLDQVLGCTTSTTAPTTANLVDAAVGQKWKVLSVQPNTTVSITTPAGLVSGMTVSGEYRFLLQTQSDSLTCRDTVSIIIPVCNCPQVNMLTPNATVCRDSLWPTLNIALVGSNTQGVTASWFANLTGGTSLGTSLSFKPAGTATVTETFYVQLNGVPSSCQQLPRTPVIVTVQNCTVVVDLALKKMINKKIAQIGDELTYTIKVFNQSNNAATGVEVTDSIATSVQFVAGSFVASRGNASISGNVIKWTIGNIAANAGANGDTVTLTYKVKATQIGLHFNTAEISKANEKDVDSTPGNSKDSEDDIDRQCFTVPIKLCPGEKVEASVPTKYTGVKWFKDGVEVTTLAGQNTVLLDATGNYTYTAQNSTCPASGCCPIIIEPGTNCCPVQICVPFTVKKIKRK